MKYRCHSEAAQPQRNLLFVCGATAFARAKELRELKDLDDPQRPLW
jgi:hypothetical protein